MTTPLSRRGVLAGSAALSVAGATIGGAPAFAATPGRRVAVLGGGMAGLTAAHELAERGFKVTVYEPTAWGGKARSMPAPHTAAGTRRDLPGEHGFRFFPGFYQHVPDTMKRVPFGSGSVFDHLVPAMGAKFLRAGDKPDGFIFGIGPDPTQVLSIDYLRRFLTDTLAGGGVPPQELAYFVERMLIFLTSCDERRLGEWEKVSWWNFIKADQHSTEYQRVLAAGLTRNLVAAKEKLASTRTIGNMGEAFVYALMGRGTNGAADRVLDLPTNEAWINPWMKHLRALGITFVAGHKLLRYNVDGGRIASAVVADRAGRRTTVHADWFVSAMPVERVIPTLTDPVKRLDPQLAQLTKLHTDWMVGIQYFLNESPKITKGHISFMDAPWALTALTQGQFWTARNLPRDYGDGKVKDILSVDISDWDTPGLLIKKPAKECTREEVAREVLHQIRVHHTAGDQLPDGIVHSWFMDPAVKWHPARRRNSNDTPLLVNTVDSWKSRPTAATKIPNLLMSGDFVRTDIDLATMEGANESAREAVNTILARSGSKATPAKKYKLYDPPEFLALKAVDKVLYQSGQKNALDVG